MVSLTADVVSVTSRIPLMLLSLAEKLGVGRSKLAAAVGLSLPSLSEEDGRTPSRLERALWREVVMQTGDSLLGVHALQILPAHFLGLFESLCVTAPSYGDVLKLGLRYGDLLHTGLSVDYETANGTLRLLPRYKAAAGEPERQVHEFTLGAQLHGARICTGRQPRVRRVCFPHPAPSKREHLQALQRVFGTRQLEFDTEAMELSFEAEVLEWPSVMSAPRLNRLLREHADFLLGCLRDKSPFLRQARRHLLGELQEGHPTVSGLAARMGLERRTLQRRLEGHCTSFNALLDELRQELAMHYLQDPELGLSEVSFRLGYSSPQSFHRAFRGWTGTAPAQWRHRLRPTPAG